jgi:hypothetical protein
MKTNEFLDLLKEHPEKELIFYYKEGHTVGANYHITEVKNVSIDSVDCGAGTDSWKETVIQLWESPAEKDKKRFMTAYKALGILQKVQRIKPMEAEAEIKFEYGNPGFHAAQLPIGQVLANGQTLEILLHAGVTDCKAKEACGVPVAQANQVEASCTPGGGCC